MRKWIKLVEDAQPKMLQKVAAYLADVNDDILPDHFLEIDYNQASDTECWNLIKVVYHSGSCEEFALAVHETYGWEIIQVRDAANPGMHHIVNKTAAGELCDVTGIVTMDELKRRYRMRKPTVTRYVGGLFDESDYHEEWGSIWVALWVVNNLGYHPFH